MSDFFVCNCYYSDFEADFLRVTSAGYMTEFEIKVSTADFRNDAKKSNIRYPVPYDEETKTHKETTYTKHEELLSGGLNIKNFYFCAPAGIIPIDEVPEKFGLIEFSMKSKEQQRSFQMSHEVTGRIIRKAKQLGKPKPITEKKLLRLQNSIVWRYKNSKADY